MLTTSLQVRDIDNSTVLQGLTKQAVSEGKLILAVVYFLSPEYATVAFQLYKVLSFNILEDNLLVGVFLDRNANTAGVNIVVGEDKPLVVVVLVLGILGGKQGAFVYSNVRELSKTSGRHTGSLGFNTVEHNRLTCAGDKDHTRLELDEARDLRVVSGSN